MWVIDLPHSAIHDQHHHNSASHRRPIIAGNSLSVIASTAAAQITTSYRSQNIEGPSASDVNQTRSRQPCCMRGMEGVVVFAQWSSYKAADILQSVALAGDRKYVQNSKVKAS